MKIKALIFDIDGTLYSNTVMHLKTIPIAFRYFGVMYNFNKVRKVLHSDSSIIDRSGMSFCDYQSQMLGEHLGIMQHDAGVLLEEFRQEWETIFDTIKPFPRVRDMVLKYREQGLKTAVLSDFPIGNKLKRLKINGIWDAEHCTEDSGAIKPDSRSFTNIANVLGVKPEEVLFIGNSHAFDIKGAKDAGMLAAHITWRKAKKSSKADFTFFKYKDLESWIDEQLSNNKE